MTKPVPISPFPAAALRTEFPVLSQKVHGKPLTYLDSGASMQKPQAVLDAMQAFYEHDYANIHRGVYELSRRATDRYEAARTTVGHFINAQHDSEIVFTKGATEAINLVANAWGNNNIRSGDEIILTQAEHHSNIVPWQLLCERTGAVLRVVPVTPTGDVLSSDVAAAITQRTRLVTVTHVSNVLGTILPIPEIATIAHNSGAVLLVDGCQAVGHMAVDVQALGADFYAFSGHKACGPTGIGVLYGRHDLLADMPPWQGGGDMITNVSFSGTTYMEPPHRFEAGTPPIAEAIGLAAALGYLSAIGMDNIENYERKLLQLATKHLQGVKGIHIIGNAPNKSGILSFVMDGVHPHDIGTVLDAEGVAIRAGHHCAQPLIEALGLVATARASLAFYNTPDDISALVRALVRTKEIFG